MTERSAVAVARVAAAVALILCLSGCDDGESESGQAGLEIVFDTVVVASNATDVDGPDQTTSKDINYVTGTGLVAGTPDEASAAVAGSLEANGWDVSEPTPTEGGLIIVAVTADGDAAAQVSVYSAVGTKRAPAGSSILQVQVADADAGLDWTTG